MANNFKKKELRVIILIEDDELPEKQWAQYASNNPGFSFLMEESENIYTLKDGKPYKP